MAHESRSLPSAGLAARMQLICSVLTLKQDEACGLKDWDEEQIHMHSHKQLFNNAQEHKTQRGCCDLIFQLQMSQCGYNCMANGFFKSGEAKKPKHGAPFQKKKIAAMLFSIV